jgi:hypothetical protein
MDEAKKVLAEIAWAGYLSYVFSEGGLDEKHIPQMKADFMAGFEEEMNADD